MIFENNFLNKVISILFIAMGIKIIWTQKLPMGIRGSGEVFIGNISFSFPRCTW